MMGNPAVVGRWYDGRVYAGIVDRLLAGVHGYVAAHLPDGQRVLDAACGTGTLSQKIARAGRAVVGVDLSPRHIDYARQRAARAGFGPDQLRFEIGDLRELEAPESGPYDVAVIVLALHEMPARIRPAVVARLASVAGQVMIVDFAAPLTWNPSSLKKRTAELAAGPSHHAAFRDYVANGGLDAIVGQAGVTTTSDRTIDSDTLRVAMVSA